MRHINLSLCVPSACCSPYLWWVTLNGFIENTYTIYTSHYSIMSPAKEAATPVPRRQSARLAMTSRGRTDAQRAHTLPTGHQADGTQADVAEAALPNAWRECGLAPGRDERARAPP